MASPVVAVRLQEAFQNSDGSMAAPHMDCWIPLVRQNVIPDDELAEHCRQPGAWMTVFDGDPVLRDGDARDGCRRVAALRHADGTIDLVFTAAT